MSGAATGRPRRELIVRLAQEALAQLGPDPVVVDVGCDHGHVAAALGAIGVERRRQRLPRREDVTLVVADGLTPFRRVDLAVITGMGAETILSVLDAGPRPAVAVLHAPERAWALRQGLAARGYRIDAEGLAPEARGYAEVMRVSTGEETATGLGLAFGPKLLDDPLLLEHVAHERARWAIRAEHASSPEREAAEAWLRFFDDVSAQRRSA
ncbi:MAG: tRNA (adenine(22)-N(1))-methyltransferase TrmK [Deltaproteobacteria bacterium]|nr:tRNA (adenine(22)-N(1))-methyltransferase TrmK [Deltaproteobacteria bacterium]